MREEFKSDCTHSNDAIKRYASTIITILFTAPCDGLNEAIRNDKHAHGQRKATAKYWIIAKPWLPFDRFKFLDNLDSITKTDLIKE